MAILTRRSDFAHLPTFATKLGAAAGAFSLMPGAAASSPPSPFASGMYSGAGAAAGAERGRAAPLLQIHSVSEPVATATWLLTKTNCRELRGQKGVEESRGKGRTTMLVMIKLSGRSQGPPGIIMMMPRVSAAMKRWNWMMNVSREH